MTDLKTTQLTIRVEDGIASWSLCFALQCHVVHQSESTSKEKQRSLLCGSSGERAAAAKTVQSEQIISKTLLDSPQTIARGKTLPAKPMRNQNFDKGCKASAPNFTAKSSSKRHANYGYRGADYGNKENRTCAFGKRPPPVAIVLLCPDVFMILLYQGRETRCNEEATSSRYLRLCLMTGFSCNHVDDALGNVAAPIGPDRKRFRLKITGPAQDWQEVVRHTVAYVDFGHLGSDEVADIDGHLHISKVYGDKWRMRIFCKTRRMQLQVSRLDTGDCCWSAGNVSSLAYPSMLHFFHKIASAGALRSLQLVMMLIRCDGFVIFAKMFCHLQERSKGQPWRAGPAQTWLLSRLFKRTEKDVCGRDALRGVGMHGRRKREFCSLVSQVAPDDTTGNETLRRPRQLAKYGIFSSYVSGSSMSESTATEDSSMTTGWRCAPDFGLSNTFIRPKSSDIKHSRFWWTTSSLTVTEDDDNCKVAYCFRKPSFIQKLQSKRKRRIHKTMLSSFLICPHCTNRAVLPPHFDQSRISDFIPKRTKPDRVLRHICKPLLGFITDFELVVGLTKVNHDFPEFPEEALDVFGFFVWLEGAVEGCKGIELVGGKCCVRVAVGCCKFCRQELLTANGCQDRILLSYGRASRSSARKTVVSDHEETQETTLRQESVYYYNYHNRSYGCVAFLPSCPPSSLIVSCLPLSAGLLPPPMALLDPFIRLSSSSLPLSPSLPSLKLVLISTLCTTSLVFQAPASPGDGIGGISCA
ncbi:hypothetical protein KCU79_g34, partial [Aureobasidium melanogenum]